MYVCVKNTLLYGPWERVESQKPFLCLFLGVLQFEVSQKHVSFTYVLQVITKELKKTRNKLGERLKCLLFLFIGGSVLILSQNTMFCGSRRRTQNVFSSIGMM